MAYIQPGLLYGARQCALVVKILHDAAITVRAEPRGLAQRTAPQKTLNLFDQTHLEMSLRPFVDAPVKLLARRRKRKDVYALCTLWGRRPRARLFGHSHTRLESNFQGALHTRPVIRKKLKRRIRVNACEHSMQIIRPAPFSNRSQSGAQAFIRRLCLEKGLAQSAQVKSGAADDEG